MQNAFALGYEFLMLKEPTSRGRMCNAGDRDIGEVRVFGVEVFGEEVVDSVFG